ncbi:MAG: hypothetical protein HN796_21950, partial [Gemmatimonadetes bacterium]|nr:hypothetical protein [Gemmatimonadota bacterium]
MANVIRVLTCLTMAATTVRAGEPASSSTDWVLESLAELQRDRTLHDWLAGHPDDEVTVYREREDPVPDWCARAGRVDTLADGTRGFRYAYFYVPPGTGVTALPEDGEAPRNILADCVLGRVRVERAFAERDRAFVESDHWIEALRTIHGPERPRPRRRESSGAIRVLGYHGNPEPRIYWESRDSLVVIAGWLAGYERHRASDIPPRTVAIAAVPTGLSSYADAMENERQRTIHLVARASRAAKRSGAESTQRDSLLQLVQAADDLSNRDRDEELSREALRILTSWLAASESRPALQRAAALLAADALLASKLLRSMGRKYEIPRMRRFQALGARYHSAPLGESYGYSNTWRNEARDLDPDGEIGGLASIVAMEAGYRDNSPCGDNRHAYRRVIGEAPALLDRLRLPSDRARVHFAVGYAWADIVGLAAGGSNYEESDMFAAEADTARVKAVESIREGLRLDGTSFRARRSRELAW